MDQKLRQQAVELAEHIMRTYYCQRDIHDVLDCMASDVTWIGPGEREKIYTLDEMRAYFEQCKDAVPACEVSDCHLQVIDLGEDYCQVFGSMTISTLPESQLILEVDQRISITFRLRGGKLEVVHLHNSNPYGELEQDEYFPHKIGSQSYQYLQRLLKEKTEVLDMIMGNINGGIKGSNDDSTYSYFYVNDGLSQMLGYTYDEFMEKTGGTAVGAVYPPDLPAALADCVRCFAQGPDYSTEYRIEKKDKTLMWVMDSGRKMIDGEGVSRINSIITDITPLKQALFDLEVERERYRMALKHITGAMCEYDLLTDLFTVYQQIDNSGVRSLDQSEIEHFSEKLDSGTFSSPEDGAAFLALCTGKQAGSAQFHTRLPYRDGSWYWIDFSCSVISDHSGAPVRAIGMMQDITEEKEQNLELMRQARRDGLTGLLNQTTAKDSIQAYLNEHGGHKPLMCALIMLDLDRFKEVNDFNGHAYGDRVLVQTAKILEAVTGAGSVLGRIGGDEFLVLIKHATLEKATQLAEEIVQRVRTIGSVNDVPISCSVGIAHSFHEGESFTEFFERTDKALYQAKHAGRDRFSIG